MTRKLSIFECECVVTHSSTPSIRTRGRQPGALPLAAAHEPQVSFHRAKKQEPSTRGNLYGESDLVCAATEGTPEVLMHSAGMNMTRMCLPMSEKQVRDLVAQALREGPKIETLSHHGSDVSSKKVIRFWREPSSSVVVKMWQHHKLRHKLRQLLQVSSAQCEIRNLAAMKRLGIRVPAPLGFAHLGTVENCQFHEAVVMEDLGQCTTGTEHIRALIASGRDILLQDFEDKIISMADALLQGAIIDRDFTVDNIVVCGGEDIRRIDVEIARRVSFPGVSSYLSSEMFGPLLATYTWAVYPNTDVVPRFMRKLRDELELSRLTWLRTEHVYNKVMRRHGFEHGGLTCMSLPWRSA